jgi:hypothetical protein
MKKSELKDFLDEKVLQYNTLDFIESDPTYISLLAKKIIAGFLSATIAWKPYYDYKNSHRMIDLMGNAPLIL